MTSRTGITAALLAGLALLLGGCAAVPGLGGSPSAAAPPSAAPTVTVTATVTPSAAPSPSATVTDETSAGRGCVGDGTIPAGAATATIEDVDHDGTRDTEFFSGSTGTYGIRTGAGAVLTIADPLSGPGRHSGWTALMDGPTYPLTVLDDGREARLYALIGCRFVQTLDATGHPFTFALAGSGASGSEATGTGVSCNDQNGGTLLVRSTAVKRSNGRYDIHWTLVDFTDQGRHATYRADEDDVRYTNLHPDDPPVLAAMRSTCNDTPIVRTSGR